MIPISALLSRSHPPVLLMLGCREKRTNYCSSSWVSRNRNKSEALMLKRFFLGVVLVLSTFLGLKIVQLKTPGAIYESLSLHTISFNCAKANIDP